MSVGQLVAYHRLWTVEWPGAFPLRPAEVIWESKDSEDMLTLARHNGYVVRGPYVLESTVGAEGEHTPRGPSGDS